MDHIGTLNTLAQIAIALIGFSGIVVIFGDRFKRGWSDEESLQFYALLSAPITIIFCSFIPEILSTLIDDSKTIWRISNAIIGVSHLSVFAYFIIKIKNAVFIQKLAGIAGAIVILAHFMAALTIIPFLEFVFIVGLLHQLSVGIINFVLLFKPIKINEN